ncbi:MAG: hypothetical protein V9E93_15195 [Steroidobacteraceae bacterium]
MHEIGAVNYVVLTCLLLAAGAGVVLGLRDIWLRMAPGQGVAGLRTLFARVNWPSFWSRGVLISKVFRRPASGLAHGLLFFGSLFQILGHGLYPLSFIGVPVYSGTFGFVVMELGRELAGIAMFLGALFLVLRRVWPPERLTAGKARNGFVPMEILFLVVIAAGFAVEALRLAHPACHERRRVPRSRAGRRDAQSCGRHAHARLPGAVVDSTACWGSRSSCSSRVPRCRTCCSARSTRRWRGGARA